MDKKKKITIIIFLILSFVLISYIRDKIRYNYDRRVILGIEAKPIYLEKVAFAGDIFNIHTIKDISTKDLGEIDDHNKKYIQTYIFNLIDLCDSESNILDTNIDKEGIKKDLSHMLSSKVTGYRYVKPIKEYEDLDVLIIYDKENKKGYIFEIDPEFGIYIP